MAEINKKDYSFAVFLVLVGILFLLNTTGMIGWGIWLHIFSYWPILFIIWGIDLIAGDSKVGKIISTILGAILLVIVGLLSYTSFSKNKLPLIPDTWNNFIINSNSTQDLSEEKVYVVSENDYNGDIEKKDFSFLFGAANFKIEDSNTTDYINATAKFPKSFGEPLLDAQRSENTLNISFTNTHENTVYIFPQSSPQYTINIGKTSLPSDIDINCGASDGEVILDESQVENVSAHVGAGDLDLTLGYYSIPTQTLTLVVGAGEISLNIPENVGYELSYDLGIGDIQHDGESIASFIGTNKTVRSTNYDSADKIITINAKVGVGSLDINTI